MQRIQLPDGSIAEFPANMPQADIERVLQQEFRPRTTVETFITDPLASIGAGVAERKAGIQQAFSSPQEQERLGQEVQRAREFQERRGLTGAIGGAIGRDVLAPVAAGAAFLNPLSAGALGTAALTGAGLGYTAPSIGAQTQGERNLNAATGAAFGLGGQTVGGVVSRLLERGGGAVARAIGGAPEVPSPAQAASRVGEALRSQYGAAREATRQAYQAVEQAGETISPEAVANVFVPQLRQAYQQVAPVIPKSGPLSILRGAEKVAQSGQPVPVSVLESLRKEAVLGGMDVNPASAFPFQQMRQAYDVAEQALPNPSALQQAARAARSSQGQLFETPQEVARIVGEVAPTGEEILQTVIGAGAKGKAGAGRVIDDVLAAAGPQAPTVQADLRQAIISRAFNAGGEDAGKLAKELNKIVSQNESLAARIFSPEEIKTIGQASKGSAMERFAETIARPATYTGGGVLGLLGGGLTAAGVAPGVGGPLALLGGTAALGAAAARQSARDQAALSMGGLLRELGVQSQAPGILSRFASPATGGITTIPAQGAFTRPEANRRR